MWLWYRNGKRKAESVPSVRGRPGSPPYRLVVAAASAGGLKALSEIISRLPPGFPLPVAVVQHVDPHRPSLLAEILNRRAQLHVAEARQGEALKAGRVYVAAPGRHLVVTAGGRIRLDDSAPIRHSRPCADLLFESAAENFGPVIAVVLSGMGHDGTSGAGDVHAGGGVVIAQDRATSQFFSMPEAAIAAGIVDYILPLSQIGATLVALAGAPDAQGTPDE